MTFRDRMKVGISAAEDHLHIALLREGLTKGMFRNYAIRLKTLPSGRKRSTSPDFCWPSRSFAFYLDGVVHHTSGARLRDERIQEELEADGWTVLRAGYSASLSKKRKGEIVAGLREALSK